MKPTERTFILKVEKTEGHCPIGEIVGKENCRSKKSRFFHAKAHVFEVSNVS